MMGQYDGKWNSVKINTWKYIGGGGDKAICVHCEFRISCNFTKKDLGVIRVGQGLVTNAEESSEGYPGAR